MIHWYSKQLFYSFQCMKSRCYNTLDRKYRFYGGKGITVCREWLNDPQSFNDWSLSNGYINGLTIDRIDYTKGYSPDNCRWISRYENSKFKSTTNSITVYGITDSGRGWANRLGYNVTYINKMLRNKGLEHTIRFIEKNYEFA